jgi:SAM-dependent methyltransferase
MNVDFGRTASDYARYRTVFPPELFTRLTAMDIGVPGHRVVDLGTGTGVLARGFATAGCRVTGVDIAAEMLAQGREQDAVAGLAVTYRVASAEDTGLPAHAWDVVSAGQCWHWFDRPRVAAEAHRLLVEGGALAICHRDYLPTPGSVSAVSEELVLAHNPDWPMAADTTDHPEWAAELDTAGFEHVESFGFDIVVAFTHEQWRGRDAQFQRCRREPVRHRGGGVRRRPGEPAP